MFRFSPEAGLRDEYDDNMGAGAARAAAEALVEAAEHVKLLTGTESPALLIGMQRRLTDATVAVERLHERQLSAAMIRQANHRADFADGWDACKAASRGLRAV